MMEAFTPIRLKVPAKAILFGEHAVVGGHRAVACAVAQYITFEAKVKPLDSLQNFDPLSTIKIGSHPQHNGQITQLLRYAFDFIGYEALCKKEGICLYIQIQVGFPVASGMGASSALCVGLATLFLLFSNKIDSQPTSRNLTLIFDLAYGMEKSFFPQCSGVDTAASLYGQAIVFDGATKQHTHIDALRDRTLWLIHTQPKHDTAQAVANSSKDSTQTKAIYSKMAAVTNEFLALLSRGCLVEHHLDSVKQLMSKNNALLEALGVGWPDAKKITDHVPGAKISGAGKGGILVAFDLSSSDKQFLTDHGYPFEQVAIADSMRIVEPDLPLYLQRLQYRIGKIVSAQLLEHNKLHQENASLEGYCSAPSNIALLKYWGKAPDALQMAANKSLSWTLSSFRSVAKLVLVKSDSLASDSELAQQYGDAQFGLNQLGTDARVKKFLDKILPPELLQAGGQDQYEIRHFLHNNFPSACGIASSAAVFTALVGAVCDLLTLSDYLSQEDLRFFMKNWARIGSGSACRSLEDGVVVWDHQDAKQVISGEACTAWDHFVVVFNPLKKKRLSSAGHQTAATSLLHQMRVRKVDENFEPLLDTIRAMLEEGTAAEKLNKAWRDFADRIENDCMLMHAVMMTSSPPNYYLNAEVMKFLDALMQFRSTRCLNFSFTLDAGPNPHILVHKNHTAQLLDFILAQKQSDWAHIYQTRHQRGGLAVGKDAVQKMHALPLATKVTQFKSIVLSGKRYVGKSWLCEQLSERLGLPPHAISDDIKKTYCDAQGLSYAEMAQSRAMKERHRVDMVAYMEQKLQEDAYYWDWKVFKKAKAVLAQEMNLKDKVIFISDARRENDLAFFKAMTNCVFIRVECSEEVRKQRGWVASEIDSEESETGLDQVAHDIVYDNNNDGAPAEESLQHLVAQIKARLNLHERN